MTGRGVRDREIATQMLLIPVVLVALLVLLLRAQPHFTDGWRLRIHRSTLDAEARASSWRSRSR